MKHLYELDTRQYRQAISEHCATIERQHRELEAVKTALERERQLRQKSDAFRERLRSKFHALKDQGSQIYSLLTAAKAREAKLREAICEFRKRAHYPHGVSDNGLDDSVSREKKLEFVAANEALNQALAEPSDTMSAAKLPPSILSSF